jgi:putative heme-binding domain-containing protein
MQRPERGSSGAPRLGSTRSTDCRVRRATVPARFAIMERIGGSVDPELTQVWDILSFQNRLESILEPSKEIKEGFGTFTVVTNDGGVITGLLLSETPEGVTLKDAQEWEARISAKEIEEKGPDKTSLMPVGVVDNLAFNEPRPALLPRRPQGLGKLALRETVGR